MRYIATIVGAWMLAGCAYVDTGQVDYRVSEAPPPPNKITEAIEACKVQNSSCFEETRRPLIRKYVPVQAPFTKGDVYSIELEQAVVGDNILEGHVLGQQFGKRGEFAILANAFEFGDNQNAGRFLQVPEFDKAKQEGSDVELKLVYFGDDVAKLQPFNFSNVPLMPRSTYSGGSVGIQMVIMEVDARSGPITSLLKTLAKFGQRSIPGPPEASNILFDLGESLLQGSQDDRLLDYRFVMSNGASVDPNGNLGPAATFAPGRYVFRRSAKRDKEMEWGDLKYDYNTGRLYRYGNAVRDELYFVLNIRKYKIGTAPETYEQASWTEFRQAVQSAADARGAPVTSLTNNLTKLLADQRSEKWQALLTGRWQTAESKLQSLSRRTVTNLDSLKQGCKVEFDEASLARDLAARDAQDAMREFVADYQAALKAALESGTATQQEFSTAARERMVSQVARYFMPWVSSQQAATFNSAAAFEAAYISPGGLALFEAASGTAAARGIEARDCAGILKIVS